MVSVCVVFWGDNIYIHFFSSVFWDSFNKTIIPLVHQVYGYEVISANWACITYNLKYFLPHLNSLNTSVN